MTEIKNVKGGDEVTISVTVQGTVWKSVDGDLMVGDGNGYEVTEENLLEHVPAPPKYKPGESFRARYGANDVVATYSPGESPRKPWLVVFNDGSYGRKAEGTLSDLRPIAVSKVEVWHLATAISNALFSVDPSKSMSWDKDELRDAALLVAEDLGLEVAE